MDPRLSRLPLRDLLTQTEHRCRELAEHLQMDLAHAIRELRRLSRTKRKHSPYPTIRAVSNSYEQVRHTLLYAQKLVEGIEDCIAAIEQRATEVRK
jgi:uncharacterized protein (DUF2461 family)